MKKCIDFKEHLLKECPANICKIDKNKCIKIGKSDDKEENDLIIFEIKKKKFILN